MSVVNNNLLLTADAATSAYQVQRSLRFNSADSAYCSRVFSTAGNRQTWTWSGWVKRATNNQFQMLFTGAAGSFNSWIGFEDSAFGNGDLLVFYTGNGSSGQLLYTNSVFRDSSAWYHIQVVLDTTNATESERCILYVNGIRQARNGTIPQNWTPVINGAIEHNIARNTNLNQYFNGYLADVHFIDGQALTPSSFTETNATTGQLVPKAYTGSYGTNGFKLNFSDNSAATAATLGADSSGNGNNWTPNNLSVTAGTGNDSLTDTPTSYGTDTGAGGEVRGNYATLNPLDNTATLSNGNLDVTWAPASYASSYGTIAIPSTGSWYYECNVTSTPSAGDLWFGISLSAGVGALFNTTASFVLYRYQPLKGIDNVYTAYGNAFTLGDVIGVAINVNGGQITFYKNGVSQGAISYSLTGKIMFPCFALYAASASVNFGQRPFAYAAPSGFKALCDTNLPAPTIAKGSSVFDATLYTGTGAALTPTSSLAFSPDLVWIKGRSGATDHALYDTVRGATLDLVSNNGNAETTQTQGLTAFNSNGFSVGTLAKLNTSAATYAAWAWDAGSSTVTNTAGTITSQVRANASAGFSVVTFTCPASGAYSFGHGLGVSPAMVIIKDRGTGSTLWCVYHSSATSISQYLSLNTTNAIATASGIWGSAITSTVVGSSANIGIFANSTAVAYCFAPVTGYSSFGSYTGNGSTDGPFVYLGFRPAFLMMKRTNTTGNWVMLDGKREGYNVDNDPLYANLSNAEGTDDLVDITSNGFKLRTTNADVNASGGTYIYAAFAENPFQYARAR